MQLAKRIFLVGLLPLSFTFPAYANELTNEYTITSSATNVGVNTWRFDYTVTNNNQFDPNYYLPTGLDGFHIAAPISATVVSFSVPDSYAAGGQWVFEGFPAGYPTKALPSDYKWLTWWGLQPPSVYPIGAIASFSITLANVTPTLGEAAATTYWALSDAEGFNFQTINPYGRYSYYYTTLDTAAPVPEPSTYALMALGLGAVAYRARRRRSVTVA